MKETAVPFKTLIDNQNAVGKRVEVNVSGKVKTYEIVSMRKVDEMDVGSLIETPEGISLTIFTCDYPDVSSRWMYFAKEVAQEKSWIGSLFQMLKASFFLFVLNKRKFINLRKPVMGFLKFSFQKSTSNLHNLFLSFLPLG